MQASDPVQSTAIALRSVLMELRQVIARLDASIYSAATSTQPAGTIGAHVRHILDHVTAVSGALNEDQTLICYDRRRRGSAIEHDRQAALVGLDDLISNLENTTADLPDRSVQVEHMLSGAGDTVRMPSYLSRELYFVMHHTIHHNAMIATRMRARGLAIPMGFGLAPATLNFVASNQAN